MYLGNENEKDKGKKEKEEKQNSEQIKYRFDTEKDGGVST